MAQGTGQSGLSERDLLTGKQAAKRLNVSERHLWTLRSTGRLPAIKLGRSVRYAQADLDAYVASCRTAGRGA